ncbi:zinc-ribbon domain-containing protein [Celeribacter sp.]|uniref:zinc-ribbon domain-containing protein n=1 Tax=Celeribacter sp. TaxID=1890673 RepID=UPI003A950773
MRLVCPNCDAQYEVDDKVIPESGRDVQCSNCGNTWFQGPKHRDADLAEEMGYEIAPDVETEHGGDPISEQPPKPDFEADEDQFHDIEPNEVSPEAEDVAFHDEGASADDSPDQSQEYTYDDSDDDHDTPVAVDEDDDEEDEGDAPVPEGRKLPSIDDSIKELLREEQEFSAPPPSSDQLEVQPNLGLEEAEVATDQAMREKMARLRGLDPADPALAAGILGAQGKRRDLLPDIEEINSTLSASSERDADGTVPDEQTRRTRVRRGTSRTIFVALVVIVLLLIVLYILAPTIANAVPATAPIMESYVEAANVFRTWLDGGMSALSTRLNTLLSQLNG